MAIEYQWYFMVLYVNLYVNARGILGYGAYHWRYAPNRKNNGPRLTLTETDPDRLPHSDGSTASPLDPELQLR